ncbi:hypothetical protein Ahia01_001073800, partial [Argonauta hians]
STTTTTPVSPTTAVTVLHLNDQDDSGNTVGHVTAKQGNATCFSCYMNHGGSLEVTNYSEDTPLDVAKSSGHYGAIQRAVKGELCCPICVKESEVTDTRRLSAESLDSLFPTPQLSEHISSLPEPLRRGKSQRSLYISAGHASGDTLM